MYNISNSLSYDPLGHWTVMTVLVAVVSVQAESTQSTFLSCLYQISDTCQSDVFAQFIDQQSCYYAHWLDSYPGRSYSEIMEIMDGSVWMVVILLSISPISK
jgi:hypothetical protein